MKTNLPLIGLLLCVCGSAQNVSQFGGIYNAINYAYGYGNVGALAITGGNTNTGNATIVLSSGQVVLADGVTVIRPLATNAPINVGNGSNMETVTPLAVGCSTPTIPDTCRITASFTKIHGAGERVTSGTVGLYEALNAAAILGGSAIVEGAWVQAGGTQGMFDAAPTFANAVIMDNRTGFEGGGGGSGTVTNIATSAPLTGGPISTTGTLGCRTATGSLSGCISAADWTTFNAKQSALTLPLSVANGGTGTASPALVAGTNVTITGSFPNQTINSTGGGGSGWTIGLLSALPATCTVGAGYFATDQPALQQIYTCSATNVWTQGFVNLGGSGCLAVTSGSLDINTSCLPQKTLANIFTAINSFNAGIQLGVYSVAGTPLPTCNGGALGLLLAVSDSTATTYGTAYTGSGSFGTPVYCDGTSWKNH